jgi:hypothetical protein
MQRGVDLEEEAGRDDECFRPQAGGARRVPGEVAAQPQGPAADLPGELTIDLEVLGQENRRRAPALDEVDRDLDLGRTDLGFPLVPALFLRSIEAWEHARQQHGGPVVDDPDLNVIQLDDLEEIERDGLAGVGVAQPPRRGRLAARLRRLGDLDRAAA